MVVMEYGGTATKSCIALWLHSRQAQEGKSNLAHIGRYIQKGLAGHKLQDKRCRRLRTASGMCTLKASETVV